MIDPQSYREARAEVNEYAAAIEREGLKVYIVEDRWGVPDSIRATLQKLYTAKTTPIEGTVLIGDIPVAMIRDAQHLTSAFKMDQKQYPRKESSVPSDRYYDDFELGFNYIDRDSDTPYFYYSLRSDSPQKLHPSIYSGRIRPTDADGTSRYDKLRKYLRKAVAEKQNPQPLDQILYVSANGFISESMTARIDEKAALYEHFPWLAGQQDKIGYIDHRREPSIKARLMNELQRNDLDFAVLHNHGDWDTQYLNNLPQTNSTSEQIRFVKMFAREMLRHAKSRGKSIDSMQMKVQERYGLPDSWFEGAFDPKVMAADSLEEYSLDLFLSDFNGQYNPNCRFVVMDACFNGSFHRDNCIANAYIFSDGKTVAALANSVNVLQDKWTDRYFGLLGLGGRAGNLAKYSPYLESHLIGDPTFMYASPNSNIDINAVIALDNSKAIRKAQAQYSAYPDVQALLLDKLFRKGEISSTQLLGIFKTSPSYIVRVEALTLLSECRDDNFIECLKLGVTDSYEMVQRFAINFVARSGDLRLLPTVISTAIQNNTSERIEFSVKQALQLYPKDALVAEFEKQFAKTNYMDSGHIHDLILRSVTHNADMWPDDVAEISVDSLSDKRRIQDARLLRNYNMHESVPQLLDFLSKSDNDAVQCALWEALGWFNYSYRADMIAGAALATSQNSAKSESVRNEALKTYNRVK